MSDLVGKTLLSQFRVDSFIAAGGMGAVYCVWDLKRNVPLAMKVLHSELAEDPSMFKRFQREARALQKLAHPNIVPFYGLYQTMDFAFMLERYVDGPSFKDVLKRQKGDPLAIEEALIYMKALCAALGYAHVNGVVHCDVKPGNVIIDRGGNIYLTDFGIARHAESTTTTMGAAGTPAYMPPEQILGQTVTPATDVYALGVMLYEMLTGRRPFRGSETSTEKSGATVNERIRYEHLHVTAKDPHELVSTIPEELAQVILRALNKKTADRFAGAPEFFEAVCQAAGVSPSSVKERIYLAEFSEKRDYETGKEVIKGAVPQSRSFTDRLSVRTGGLVIAGVIGCVVIAIATILLLNNRPAEIVPGSDNLSSSSQELSQPNAVSLPVELYSPSPALPDFAAQTFEVMLSQPAVLPTFTPTNPPPSTDIPKPYFTASQSMNCREMPDTSANNPWQLNEGETVPVLAKWSGNPKWLLVGIDDPGTRTECCWVGGEGSLNVSLNSIKSISFFPDRLDCSSVR
jgi:serine/threonine protein kinase